MPGIMENEMFNAPMDIGSQNSILMGGIPNSLVGSNSFDFNGQNHLTRALAGFPVLSELQEPICDIHPDLPSTSNYRFFDSNAVAQSLGRNAVRDASRAVDNIDFQEQLERGTSISATSLANLLAARRVPQENLNDLAVSVSSIYPFEVSRSNIANDFPNDLNSSFATSVNCGCDEILGNMNGKWLSEKSRAPPDCPGETPLRTGFLQSSYTGDLHPNGWIPSTGFHVTADCPYGSSKNSNELSLSLARSQPALIGEANITDHCSEIGCSGETCHYLNATKLQSEHPSSRNSNKLSLSFGSYGPAQFSQLTSGSTYLHAIQEILAQIASFSLENLDGRSYLSGERMIRENTQFPSCSSDKRGMPPIPSYESSNVDGNFKVQADPSIRRQTEARKAQLLTLLQVVDDRYNQCLDEIHTVVSAFHAATEFNPPMHARFALQTVSSLYKNLRERISSQILAMGAYFESECTRGKEVSFEDSFIKEQWALQQLKRKEHQIWRPQRGLPEKSVAVLRTWMFQNFLHPYPKDAEKHLLAAKSGLTRSQVSNWFINARVRLWKPMIEEMYREMNRRKARRIEEGNNSNHISQLSRGNQRFSIN